jgi:hypothetical protein
MSGTHSVATHPAAPTCAAEGGNRRADLALPVIAKSRGRATLARPLPDKQWEMP